MSNVIIDREKIDILANAISDKSGVPVTMTLDEMVEAVDSIETGGGEPTLQSKTYTVDSAGTETVAADSGYDGLSEVEVTVPEAFPYIGHDREYYTSSGQRRWRVRGRVLVDASEECPPGYYDEGTYYGSYTNFNAIPTGTTVTPTESSQTIGGANYMMEGAVTVNAIPTTYVGSGIYRADADDVTFITDEGEYVVVVNDGYYDDTAVKAVPTGTEGTPTATKGTVSNHSVSVTPSVTNSAGYIEGGTKTGTAVTVSASELVSGSETKTENGTYNVTNLAELVVNVPTGSAINNQNKSVTPSESQQSITADNGYTGLGTVTVGAISTTYVGSGITRRSSTDLTVSGATVTAPAGYYSAAASKSVASMTPPTSAASSATSGYTSKATIGRSTAAQYINIPPGYNSAGAYYVISATPNGSVTAPSSISGTAASVSTGTNTLTLTKTVSVTPNVTTAGYISSGTAGNSSISLTASVTTKAAATITPTTTNQTIAAGTYITGTQTIAGDADLVGSNILSTANIFGVQGTVVVQNYYTGSSAPSSSLGSNGDLYLQS